MIKIMALDCIHPKYGTWTYSNTDGAAVGGKPFPSEAEAHVFQTRVIPLLEKELARILRETFNVEY